MLIREILEELKKEKVSVSTLGKRIEGLSEKPLRAALKNAGYDFQNKKPKGWFYIAEGDQPLDHSIFDYVETSSPGTQKKVKKDSHPSAPIEKADLQEVKPISQKIPRQGETHVKEDFSKLMYEELKAIRGLLQTEKAQQRVIPQTDLLTSISGLNKSKNKTRKTIVIDEQIAKQLDQFSKKKRVNKSDLIEVALLNLFERFGEEQGKSERKRVETTFHQSTLSLDT